MKNLERIWILILLWTVSLIMALLAGGRLFFSLTYLFTAILSLSYLWAWLNLHWIGVTRQVNTKHKQVGNLLEESFTVKNTGWLPKLWLELKEDSDLPAHSASRVISNLRGKQQYSWQVQTPCHRRGRFRLGPIILTSGDPFGLFILKKELPQLVTTVVVYPIAVDLPAFHPPIGKRTGERYSRSSDILRSTTNISGIREYVPGDSFNHIHWPSTARTGRMMVKEFELDHTADIWIFLDMEKRVQAGLSYNQLPPLSSELPPSSEEYIIAIAASISKKFLRQNRAVGLITYCNGQHREIAQRDRGERQLTRIYELLAAIHAHGTIPLSELLATETIRFGRNSTLIIITPSIDDEWVAAAHHLISRGTGVTAVVVDPNGFGMPCDFLAMEIELTANHIPHYIIHKGEPLDIALANSPLFNHKLR